MICLGLEIGAGGAFTIACFNRLKAWGAEFSKDNVKLRNAIDIGQVPQRSFKVLDPDGNVVDVTANREEWRGIHI